MRLRAASLAIACIVGLCCIGAFGQGEADQAQPPAVASGEAGTSYQASPPGESQSSTADPEAEPAKPKLEVHGFLQENASVRATKPVELLKAESRLQLELTRKTPQLEFLAKTDFIYDPVVIENGRARVDLREGYLTWYRPNLDLRVGRQIITWGVGDLIFVTDLFPKDWVAFITGAPIEYLKKGSTAAKANLYLNDWSLEAIFIPTFERDTLPSGDELAHFVPFPQAAVRRLVLPPKTLPDSELALRASRMIGGYSTSLYLFHGFDPAPSFHFDPAASTVTEEHHRLNMIGASAQGNSHGYLLSGEFAYYRTQDLSGTNPEIANPSLKLLLVAERVIKENRTAAVQLLFDGMLHHGRYEATLPPGFPSQPRLRKTVTLRMRDSLHRDTFRPTVYLLYNMDDRDFFVKAEYQQDLAPGTWYALGVNLFGGRSRFTMYGQFQGDENIYFTIRRAF